MKAAKPERKLNLCLLRLKHGLNSFLIVIVVYCYETNSVRPVNELFFFRDSLPALSASTSLINISKQNDYYEVVA
jgi:hypothetical protein